jgi:hypothetical protein
MGGPRPGRRCSALRLGLERARSGHHPGSGRVSRGCVPRSWRCWLSADPWPLLSSVGLRTMEVQLDSSIPLLHRSRAGTPRLTCTLLPRRAPSAGERVGRIRLAISALLPDHGGSHDHDTAARSFAGSRWRRGHHARPRCRPRHRRATSRWFVRLRPRSAPPPPSSPASSPPETRGGPPCPSPIPTTRAAPS